MHLAILYGGKSAEHDVSLLSAKSIVQEINKEKYIITLVKIDKDGKWRIENIDDFLSSDKDQFGDGNEKFGEITPFNEEGGFNIKINNTVVEVDVILPVLHGPNGEDGTIQGLIKLADVAFVGAGVLGSAVGMDKDVMKRLLHEAGLPIVDYVVYREHEKNSIDSEKIGQKFNWPVFVKPANLGSSVGISKVDNKESLQSAIDLAFSYDNKILIEKAIKGKEIECSVLEGDKPRASVCGEIVPKHSFYSYEAKYLDDEGAAMSIPAKINKKSSEKIQELAIKTFEVLECAGLARVDFFLTDKNEIFVNEINTFPGFTTHSMYPKLWEASGIPYSELIDKLIISGVERYKQDKKFSTSRF